MEDVARPILVALVLVGAIPLVAGCYQFLLAGLYALRMRTPREPFYPRVAIVIPAWNEAAVVERTLDRLLALEYPADCVRIYVVDDASTDETPRKVLAKAAEHPGRIFHLRRERGGEGKAHTINHGLRIIRAEGWYEAILVIDADVIFTPPSLRRMTRHLSDERVGAVTGYIKEGSRPGNWMNRFVSFEYVTAQAAARRAQNVLGAQACLAGGAQLLRRESLEAVGGEIDTSTLAEDTVTTLGVQLAGKKVVFEPHAIVWAEEPREITGLWKQRLRWGRGNVQVTRRFRHIWLRRGRAGSLGGIGFALIWFSVFLMPVFMLTSSASLVALWFIDDGESLEVFRTLWFLNVVTYLFVTLSSFSIDPETAKRTWREGLLFPGAISLGIILYALYPPLFEDTIAGWLRDAGIEPDDGLATGFLLFAYVWLSASMLAAWLVKLLDSALPKRLRGLCAPLLYVVGYGPLLCAITAAAYVKEARGAEMRWDKTEKTGAVGELT
ncbi:glycosyltransferase family 2 protein [Conexibacter stalactiti]|uniref:Glycosyltransferase family 2 protein n=1 Tax=Conexibacter stalactiti TaxID=1940611 RepID=A0ABU4HS68_9ACTN|nr:glycosyltransferase family 2 protein [Conexibacter stalactiti]MDW5594904.1 glycosyltransferase family 2 protein [Conexibacter stalactiti]MEC5035546.1 glycosyltransferase family 2 protein [Conexibacter stalactiti]